MRQKYILERLLLRYIASVNTLSPQKVPIFDGIVLPNQLKFTSEFTDYYSQMVQKIVLQRLVETFAWRIFFFSKDDTTYRCTVADPMFWQDIKFCFTQKGANALWLYYTKKQVPWESLNPWDAMFINMIVPQVARSYYSDEWLLENDAHWLVIAYFMITRNENFSYRKIPHNAYFRHFKKIVYPLRFLLIELAAVSYGKIWKVLHDVQESSSDGYWDSGYRYDLDLRDRRFWTWLGEMESHLDMETVANAYEYWCNEGIIGYDDSDFLQKSERECQLFKNISDLKEMKKSLGSINLLGENK